MRRVEVECDGCGKVARVPLESLEPPVGWVRVRFLRPVGADGYPKLPASAARTNPSFADLKLGYDWLEGFLSPAAGNAKTIEACDAECAGLALKAFLKHPPTYTPAGPRPEPAATA